MSTAAVVQPGFTFNEELHEYKDDKGVHVLSTTQVLAAVRLVEYSSAISEEVMERKSKIGGSVHAAVHFLTENDLDWETVPEVCTGYVLAAERMLQDLKFKPVFREHQGLATLNSMRYGFKLDLAGYCDMGDKVKPLPLIIELKTCTAEHISWRLQLASYECALPRPEGMPFWARAAAILKPDGTYKLRKYDDPRDRDVWLQALYLTTWGRNNGLYKEVK
jgi:hypothetical protein